MSGLTVGQFQVAVALLIIDCCVSSRQKVLVQRDLRLVEQALALNFVENRVGWVEAVSVAVSVLTV